MESMKQYLVTPAMGKRLIAKSMMIHPSVQAVLKKGILVIVAGTTNGYVAQEILNDTAQGDEFERKGFRRGLVTPPGFPVSSVAAEFGGDVVLVDGVWQKGLQIFDVVDSLQAGDVILKGANAVNLQQMRAGVYIGHEKSGTIGAAIPVIAGKRVRLIVPVGLEKRIYEDVSVLADELNAPNVQGPRMLAMPGQVVTELQAIESLTGAKARLLAGGGVYGAEGAVWIGACGTETQLASCDELLGSLANEPLCQG